MTNRTIAELRIELTFLDDFGALWDTDGRALCLRIIDWVRKSASIHQIASVRLIFRVVDTSITTLDQFEATCALFLESLRSVIPVQLTLCTNAKNLNVDWISVFAKYRIFVIVDLNDVLKHRFLSDLPPAAYLSEAIDGIRILQRASAHDLINPPRACLTLGNGVSGDAIYQYLINDLGFVDLDFVFPHESHDQVDAERVQNLARQLGEIHRAWMCDTNLAIRVLLFDQFLKQVSNEINSQKIGLEFLDDHVSFTIDQNGEVGLPENFDAIGMGLKLGSLWATPITTLLKHPLQMLADSVKNSVSEQCYDCGWVGHCRSGTRAASLISRFSTANGFSNKSVFCEALDELYFHLARQLATSESTQRQLIATLMRLRSRLKFDGLKQHGVRIS